MRRLTFDNGLLAFPLSCENVTEKYTTLMFFDSDICYIHLFYVHKTEQTEQSPHAKRQQSSTKLPLNVDGALYQLILVAQFD